MSKSEKYSVSQNETADELAAHLSKVSFDEDELSSKITTMRKRLNSLECPFTWWPSQTICSDEGNFARVQKEREEIQDEEMYEYVHWRTFILNLVLCHEYHKKGCISESLLELNECENILKSRPRGDAGSISSVGLWHVCLATKCFVQFKSGQYVQVEQTLAEIRLPVQMTKREQAVLWGCRAAFFMEYGSVGTKQAVDHAKRALQLDPEQGEWHFLLGKALFRTRCIDKYSGKELIAVERAVELTNSPDHIIFLAQAYDEMGVLSPLYMPMDYVPNILLYMHMRSSKLFRKAFELKPNSCHISTRCAEGFLNLMQPYCNIDLAKECIDRALSVAPSNARAHFVAGTYFQHHRKDLEQAKKHYTLAGEKGAYSALLKLLQTKYQQNHRYNPVPDLEKLLEQYQDSPYQQETLCQLGSYHCFIKNDPKTALGYWQRAVKLDPESARLQNHVCIFINMVKSMNIHELVLNEARLFLQCNMGSDEDCAMWRKVISDYAVSHPELGQGPPVRSGSEKDSLLQSEASSEEVAEGEVELSSKIRTIQQQLECPFTWWASQTTYIEDRNISRVEKTRAEIQDEECDEDFRWCTFVLNLVLCYEYHKQGCFPESLAKLVECEEILKAKPKGDAGSVASIPSVGLWHICLACKCFLQLESGKHVQAEKTLAKIRLSVQMTETEQASLWGCRAAFWMQYGTSGTRQAVDHAERALQLDPQQGEWHFLLGKALGRIRRVDNYDSIPEKKELKALQMAVALTDSPNHIIFLAQTYRETTFRVFSLHRDDMHKYKEICDSMNKHSAELYRKVLELKQDSLNINIRCAQGFLKLPWPYRNVALAKECIDRALSLSSNNAMAHHVAGTYFERYGNDLEQAKKHYTLAGENGAYGAWLDLFRVKYQQNTRYNPVPDLERLLEQHEDTSRQQQTLCELGSYYCFIKNDLKTALGYWQRIMEMDPESTILQSQKCAFINMKKPVNIHELVLDEARLIVQSNTGSDEDCAMWRKVISDYAVSHPELGCQPPIPRREMVLGEARRNQRTVRGRGRGGYKRRWHQVYDSSSLS